MNKVELTKQEDESDNLKWTYFVRSHVMNNQEIVFKNLFARALSEAQTIVLDYLDGYMSWCTPSKRKKFKNYFMTQTSFKVDEDFLKYRVVDDVSRPQSESEARKNLYFFLVLWRTIYSLSEPMCCCYRRISQIYDWEINNNGPVSQLCRNPHNTSIRISEDDIDNFYQDGIKQLEHREVNFDDINGCANSEVISDNDGCVPHTKKWLRKIYREPEGLWALIVGIRNYYSILFFNIWILLVSWAWYSRRDIDITSFLIIDGSVCAIGGMIELLSRFAVYSSFVNYFGNSIPFKYFVFQVFIYITGILEVLIWFGTSKMKLFPQNMNKILCFGVLIISVSVRIIYNILLYIFFPSISRSHFLLKPTTFPRKYKKLIKLFLFFSACGGILLPLNYWFSVPTLQKSAFWRFCSGLDVINTQAQCYIGIIGLWVPLLSIVLIIDFIAYSCILGLFGAYLARSRKVGYTTDESFSVVSGFRVFSNLLKKWTTNEPRPDETSDIHNFENGIYRESMNKDKIKKNKGTKERYRFVTLIDPAQIEGQMESMYNIWYLVIDDMIENDLISKELAQSLYSAFNWQDLPLTSTPRQMIQFFFSSLTALSPSELNTLGEHANYLEKMPGLTQLIPSYGEVVVFDTKYLRNTDHKKISNIEFMVLKSPKDWEYFYERMKLAFSGSRSLPANHEELLDIFLNNPETLDPYLIDEIRLWASFRGQTIYKTIRGSLTYITALRAFFEITGRGQMLVPFRTQVILAHQQYGDPSVLKIIAQDIKLMYRKLSTPRIIGEERYGETPFDLVFDWNPKDLIVQKSFLMRLSEQENEEDIKRYTLKTIHREQEMVCAHGDALKRLIDSKCTEYPIDPKFGFSYASIKAGLPKATRIKGRVWLLRYTKRSLDEFCTKKDEIQSESDSDSESMSEKEDDGEFKPKRHAESFTWEHIATGLCVLHVESNLRDMGWLRIYNIETGRELEFEIYPHIFEVKPISFYSWSGKETDALKDVIYCVFKFGIKTGKAVKIYALACILQDEIHGVKLSEINSGESGDPLAEKGGRNSFEITNLRRSLTHPRKYLRNIEIPKKSEIYSSMKSVCDLLSDFSIEGCLAKNLNPTKQNSIFLGIQIYTVIPRRNPLIIRIRGELPFGESDCIQGKASNQANGLKFAYGLVIQTKDANQGGSLLESIKFPIILSRFGLHESAAFRTNVNRMIPPAIIGFRESIFTKTHGSIARYQAQAEWTFVTIVQRVIDSLGIRMHYGHPDFFDATWVFSRCAISKSNPIYNLSEDIFAGYVAILHERRSVYTDQIQDEKGRDTSLASTYTYTAKLAQGASSQMKSSDIFHLNTRLDFIRQFLLFNSTLGYYFATALMLYSVKTYLFGLLVFTIAGYSAENLGNFQFIYSVPFLVQVGMFTLVPLALEKAMEEGFWEVLKVIIDAPLSLMYFLFQSQTTFHHAAESFIKGKSYYKATGRLLSISTKSLVEMYEIYGKSHYEPAFDYLFYVLVYYIITNSRAGGYIPLFAPIICIAVFLLAPTLFQISFSYPNMFVDVSKFGSWIFASEPFTILLKEWKNGPIREQIIKNLTWKATYKTSYTRLQTYNIFNSLKSVMNTHYRVDIVTAVTSFLKAIIWGFIILTIPGTMKDNVAKVVTACIIYILLSLATTFIMPKYKKGYWYSLTHILFALTIAYFIFMFFSVQGWIYIPDLIIGLFLALKLTKSVSYVIFYIYSAKIKVNANIRWLNIEKKHDKKKITLEDKDKLTKKIKSNLETMLLSGIYLLDSVDRPFILIAISIILIPLHIAMSLIWCIPYISGLLMYHIIIKTKSQAPFIKSYIGPWGIGSAYNSFASPTDMEELPEFDFEEEAEILG